MMCTLRSNMHHKILRGVKHATEGAMYFVCLDRLVARCSMGTENFMKNAAVATPKIAVR